MAGRVVGVLADDRVRRRDRGLGGALVARLPVVDVGVLMGFLLIANQSRAGLFRLLRADNRRKHVVVDEDRVARVFGLVLGLSDDRRDLCPWKGTFSVPSTACVSPASVGIQASLVWAITAPGTTAIPPGID